MARFYIAYYQDCGGGMMVCHSLIDAASREDVERNWVQIIRSEGFACHPVWHNRYEILEEVTEDTTLEECDRKYSLKQSAMDTVLEEVRASASSGKTFSQGPEEDSSSLSAWGKVVKWFRDRH